MSFPLVRARFFDRRPGHLATRIRYLDSAALTVLEHIDVGTQGRNSRRRQPRTAGPPVPIGKTTTSPIEP